MESNWRFNVWEYGLWGTKAVLVARCPYLFPFGEVLIVRHYDERWAIFIYGQSSLNLWVPITGVTLTGVPFPAGYPVDPDH